MVAEGFTLRELQADLSALQRRVRNAWLTACASELTVAPNSSVLKEFTPVLTRWSDRALEPI
jgi:hypothetical protein